MIDPDKSKAELCGELEESRQLVARLRAELSLREEAEEEMKAMAVGLEAQVDDFTRQIAREIAQKEKAEESLARERNLLRTLIDNLPDLIYVKDSKSRFLIANKAFIPFFGVNTVEEIIGKTDFDLLPQELAEGFYAEEQEIMRTGKAKVNYEETNVDRATGRECRLLSTKVPFHDSKGEIRGLVCISKNITDYRRPGTE